MPVIRLILLLVVLGGLTLLLVQNWSPVLPLVFLGVKTQSLPLAIWILFSVVAGVFTSLLMTGLFQLSNYFAHSRSSKRRNKTVERSNTQQRSETRYTAAERSQRETNSTPSNASDDDWDDDATNGDDWDFEQDADDTQNSSSQNPVRTSTNYEVNNEPKSGYRSGSVYSYSYREPSNSSVGKTESVYDADYRVLTPPYRQTDTLKEEDDWGFDDDDDFEDEGDNDSQSKQR